MNRQLLPLIIIAIITAAGGIYYLTTVSRQREEPEITNFEECAKAGYRIQESSPAICRPGDGRFYVQTNNR